MRQFKVPGQPAPQPPTGLETGEKKRLLALTFGVLLVVAALVYGNWKEKAYQDEEYGEIPASQVAMAEEVLLPELDGARIDTLVADSEPLDRVVLETDAVDVLLEDARRLTTRHFEELGEVELDVERIAAIEADPSANRARPFYARGIVDAMRTRRRGNDTEYIGRLRLDDESLCYFLVLDLEDAPENGAYVRVDGLFLKLYAEEDQLTAGEWIEAPLLVGPRALRSYRSFGPVTEPRWALFDDVEDAELLDAETRNLVLESPFEPLWTLMAYARDLPADAIDWESAPELDSTLMTQLIEDPDTWRLQPIRVPISRVQDGRVLRAGENPARIDRYTQGWMGNHYWPNVIKFLSPVPNQALQLKDFAYGNGFFLHNFAYESAGRGLRIAPVVVLTDVHRFESEQDPLWLKLGIAFGIFTVALIVLFTFLVLRDRKRSKSLQEELVRRRRARRGKSGGEDTPLGQPSA